MVLIILLSREIWGLIYVIESGLAAIGDVETAMIATTMP